MKALLTTLFSVLILIIVALLVIPSFIDWSQYKDQIRTQVSNATGYELTLDGPLKAAFLPVPHVSIENASINSGTAEGPVAFQGSVQKASVSLDILPLLSGTIAVNDVTLNGLKADVQQRQQAPDTTDGAVQEQPAAQTGDNPAKSPSVQIDSLTLKDAALSYKPLDGDAMAITIPELTLNADSLQGPARFDGRVLYKDFNLALDGRIGALSKTEPVEASLSVDGGAYKMNFAGLVDLSKTDPEIQGQTTLNAESLHQVFAALGQQAPAIKDQAISLTGFVTGTGKTVSVANGKLKLGSAPETDVRASYSLADKKGKVALQNIPGGGMVDLDIAMADGATAMAGHVNVNSLPALLATHLGLVDIATFKNPQVPQSLSGDITASLGKTMKFSSKEMTAGSYLIRNTSGSKSGDQLNLSIADFEGAKISVSGKTNAEEGLIVDVQHPNAARFIQVFQKDFKSSAPLSQAFRFKGLVKPQDKLINLSDIDATIGAMALKGSASVQTGATVPSVKADLVFGTVDTKALLGGKQSSAATGGGTTGGASPAAATSSGGAPWTRDAIDTGFMRSVNLDLKAKAQKLIHGPWVVSNPAIDITLQNGVLTINDINGGFFDGTIALKGKASAIQADQPLSVDATIDTNDINLGPLVMAATGQKMQRVQGKGSLNLSLSTRGLSSSALIYGLNGDGTIKTDALTIIGLDLAKVTEAISDESLTDLAAVIEGAFKNGQTTFKPINHALTIREGTMPVNNLTLESDTARMISNGEVSFARWTMDLKNTIQITDPQGLPEMSMTIKGPLNAPKQNVANDLLKSFIVNKYGAKLQKKLQEKLGDKLGDSPAGAIINNLLGGQPQQQQPATEQDNSSETQQEQPVQQQPKIEEQLIRGLFDKIGK